MDDPSVSLHPLDRATTLSDHGSERRRGQTSDDYWAFIGPFGGASSAILLRSVLEHPAVIGEPLSLTVNFCAPLARGEYEVLTRAARTNRSTQHWLIELQQNGDTILTASAVTAERRESWSHQPAQAPTLPPPHDIQPRGGPPGTPPWVRQYEFRFAHGDMRALPEGEIGDSHTLLWMRDAPPRALDHIALAALADAFIGRIFPALGKLVPFGTVSLTTYFLASAGQVAGQGDRPLRGVAHAKRFNRNYCDQTVDLFGDDGTLFATGVQIAYFKA